MNLSFMLLPFIFGYTMKTKDRNVAILAIFSLLAIENLQNQFIFQFFFKKKINFTMLLFC